MNLRRKDFILYKNRCIGGCWTKENPEIVGAIMRSLRKIRLKDEETVVSVYFIDCSGTSNCVAKMLMLRRDKRKHIIYKERFILSFNKEEISFKN